jgi:spore maturation protein B
MKVISSILIPLVVLLIVGHGALKGVDVFSEFLQGAKKGFRVVLNITPSLIALILLINMLRASGGLDILCNFLSPISNLLGIPKELTPLTILSPISGSGSIGLFESILKEHGADTFIGRCASIMMGSTETTFYTMTIYYGSIGIKKTRHTLPSALCADITSFILSPVMVNLFF